MQAWAVVETSCSDARYSSMSSSTRCRTSSTQRLDGPPRDDAATLMTSVRSVRASRPQSRGHGSRVKRRASCSPSGPPGSMPTRSVATLARHRTPRDGRRMVRLGVVTSFPALALSQACVGSACRWRAAPMSPGSATSLTNPGLIAGRVPRRRRPTPRWVTERRLAITPQRVDRSRGMPAVCTGREIPKGVTRRRKASQCHEDAHASSTGPETSTCSGSRR